MICKITFAPEARDDYDALSFRARGEVRDAINRHLSSQPTQISKSRIKRLRGLRKPQYRLRVGDARLFYDVREDEVEVLGIVEKSEALTWLQKSGVDNEEDSTS